MTDFKDLSDDERARLPKGERQYLAEMDGGKQEELGRAIHVVASAHKVSYAEAHDMMLKHGSLAGAIVSFVSPYKDEGILVEGETGCSAVRLIGDAPNGIPVHDVPCYLVNGHEGPHRGWERHVGELCWDTGGESWTAKKGNGNGLAADDQ